MMIVTFAIMVVCFSAIESDCWAKPENVTLQDDFHFNKISPSESEDELIVSSRRGVVEFGLMILCHVGRNPLDYSAYGCYCGLGGKGQPIDDTDRCCLVHDQCYTAVVASGICPFDNSIYVMPYSRKGCYQCEPSNYYWFYGECRNALCQCDSEAVKCFKRSRFDFSLKSYSKEKC